MKDDGTRANRIARDGSEHDRGSSQTHGSSDASGVDAAPNYDEIHPDTTAVPPSGTHGT